MGNEQIVECLLCGGSTEIIQKEYPGYQEPETFDICHCPTCNTSFSLPRINTARLYENIYKNGDSVPGYDRYWEYARKVNNVSNPLEYLSEEEETYWGVTEALSHLVPDKKSSNILEIGSGLGYLTYSLIKANYNVVGIDISQVAVEQATETFGDHYILANLHEYALSNLEKYDVVILTEVIEHIDQPIEFIESIIKLLKPGGKAIITTPNKTFYPGNIIWATELPPVHCWWFSEDSMRYIASRLEVTIKFIDFSTYYQKKCRYVNFNIHRNRLLLQPFLDKQGELIIQSVRKNGDQKSYIRSLITKIPFFRNTYMKFKRLINPNIALCNERGIVLCAIFSKI